MSAWRLVYRVSKPRESMELPFDSILVLQAKAVSADK